MQTSKLDNSVNILFKNECTGCSVCYISCPHNAINMIETKEGFHYPVINKEKCTNCGVCVKKCHFLNAGSYYSQQEMKGHGKNTMLESVF